MEQETGRRAGENRPDWIDEQRFRITFESAAIGIACVDMEGRPIETNEALRKMLGYSGEELRAMVFTQFTHPEDIALDRFLFDELVQGKRDHYRIEKRYLRKDGQIVWGCLSLSMVRRASGEPDFAVAMVEDISDRKRAEEALLETYETLHAVIKASPIAIFSVDPEGTVKSWNTAAEHIFGWDAEEVLGRPIPIVPPDKQDEARGLREIVLRGESLTAVETQRQRKDGSLIDVSISTAPLRDARGAVTGIMAIMADITEHRKAENAIKEMNIALQEKNREIEEVNQSRKRFFSYISHELKTPLNSIVGFTQLLRSGNYGDLNDRQSRALGLIYKNAGELLRLINNILDLAKAESGKLSTEMAETDLSELMERICTTFEPIVQEKALALNRWLDPAFPKGWRTDPDKIRSILTNLLSNAVKFTEKGAIDLEVRFRPETRTVSMVVSDTGLGIGPAELGKIFEEYGHSSAARGYRAEYAGGTGLGLAIVKGMVTSLQGKIEIVSRPGKGTTFTVILPESQQGEPSKSV
ncbi:MAG TPA: PAS domain S-box protein [Candidatus Manganitrophaceae bacterium]|nr:PAS domain S-box protein [Candidatus Manganitrophaceae bacterium]